MLILVALVLALTVQTLTDRRKMAEIQIIYYDLLIIDYIKTRDIVISLAIITQPHN